MVADTQWNIGVAGPFISKCEGKVKPSVIYQTNDNTCSKATSEKQAKWFFDPTGFHQSNNSETELQTGMYSNTCS